MKWLLGVAVCMTLTAGAAEARTPQGPVSCFSGDRIVQCATQHKRTTVKRKASAPVYTIVLYSGSDLVSRAERYMGFTASQLGVRRSLWCAAFMNKLLDGGTGSNFAYSYRRYGSPAQPGCVGCIAVTTRRGGGHVGVVEAWTERGALIISGNHNNRVDKGMYPRTRIVALRWP